MFHHVQAYLEVTLSSVPYYNGGNDSQLSWSIFDSAGTSLLSMSTYTRFAI